MDSTRFIGPITGSLHARSVPPVENVDSRIPIGVVDMPARGTHKGCLVLAAPFVYGSTDRACLGTKSGINLNQVSAFIGKHLFNLEPPNIQDDPVKSAFLSNVLTWGFNRSLRTLCHILGSKALDNNSPILSGNAQVRRFK